MIVKGAIEKMYCYSIIVCSLNGLRAKRKASSTSLWLVTSLSSTLSLAQADL